MQMSLVIIFQLKFNLQRVMNLLNKDIDKQAEELGERFNNVELKMSRKRKNRRMETILNKCNKSVISICTLDQFHVILKQLLRNKAPGDDCIPYEALKFLTNKSIKILYSLFCRFLSTSTTPNSWISVIIIPIYKKANSLSQTLRKVFEKSVYQKPEQSHKPGSFQFGYKEHHSIYDAMFRLHDHRNSIIDEKKEEAFVLKIVCLC
jgi:hypothetical protein